MVFSSRLDCLLMFRHNNDNQPKHVLRSRTLRLSWETCWKVAIPQCLSPGISSKCRYLVLLNSPVMTSGTGTASSSNQEPCGNGVLPPRLEPFVPYQLEDGVDLLDVLDPLSDYCRMRQVKEASPSARASESHLTREEEMKILYADAPFASQSRCNFMVTKFNGDIARALEELKIQQLVDTQIAPNRQKAKEALNAKAGDINAAAEMLLSNMS
ncbi:hypothetical protein KIN20_036603 [Parelaphostrongylus tenuis]|uniref:UBA domain-containing protein n=1 Tax=Parelaphostrongylus tenuis TaxID=148309 RepID=A0AAD5WLB7_PARTN|nr:hypothetical protein KIN20_036603 [Parelaphostrongylus tenuis]